MTAITEPDPRVDRRAPQWTKCPGCENSIYLRRLNRHHLVCPDCSYHLRLGVRERLELLLDDGSFQQLDATLTSTDPLRFADTKPYARRLLEARQRAGLMESVLSGTGRITGFPVQVAMLDFSFMGGSIGGTTGELVARAARRALETRTPLLIVSASGGARMQEGVVSLMQLAKTSLEIGRLREHGILLINLNTDPTYGGATASFSMLGDVVIAEPGARIGFAGPSVIQQTIRQELPDGFQSAEFLADHGMVDLVVPREAQRSLLGRLLAIHERPARRTSGSCEGHIARDHARVSAPPLPNALGSSRRPAAEVVTLARELARPTTLEYCAAVFDDFVELHGDRLGTDDPAIVGGIGLLAGRPVVAVGHQKGHDTAELIRRNFGMPQPGGYHKARRMMKYAARFGFPLVTFVDTPGAYPGIEAERSGQGTAIAECILEMSLLPVTTIVVVTGEGGSGGALALGVGDRMVMLENAYFSVISPEGCSTILFGDTQHAGRVAEALRITAPELLRLGVVDAIVPEPDGGAHRDPKVAMLQVRNAVLAALEDLPAMAAPELLERRQRRLADIGSTEECDPVNSPHGGVPR